MPDPGQTSTGQATLATTGNMPPQPKAEDKIIKYMTSLGLKTLEEIKSLLAKGELHLSHLGDDVLKILNQKLATTHSTPVVPFTDPNAPKAPTPTGGGTPWGSGKK